MIQIKKKGAIGKKWQLAAAEIFFVIKKHSRA